MFCVHICVWGVSAAARVKCSGEGWCVGSAAPGAHVPVSTGGDVGGPG